MIITLSKDDMEQMLGANGSNINQNSEDEFANLESEFVDFD